MNEDKFCTNCGSEIDLDDKVCKSCGKELSKSSNITISNIDSNNSERERKEIYKDYEHRNYPNNTINNKKAEFSESTKPSYQHIDSFNSDSDENKSASLLRRFFNFDIFITTSILKLLYIALTALGLIALPLSLIFTLVYRDISFLIAFIFLPLGLVLLRIYFELLIAILKLVENTYEIKNNLKK